MKVKPKTAGDSSCGKKGQGLPVEGEAPKSPKVSEKEAPEAPAEKS
jgi:hypothetical protein